ncbi:hypothetical protein HT031_006482 [Scenedesmus sp. PABB004]|nr:hypothetical protein HT031_006482 [Scenedesmus sp. PABB004]
MLHAAQHARTAVPRGGAAPRRRSCAFGRGAQQRPRSRVAAAQQPERPALIDGVNWYCYTALGLLFLTDLTPAGQWLLAGDPGSGAARLAALQWGGFVSPTLVWMRRRGWDLADTLRLAPPARPTDWLAGFGAGALLWAVINLAIAVKTGNVDALRAGAAAGAAAAGGPGAALLGGGGSVPALLLTAALSPAVAEELLFRGLLLTALRERLGSYDAVALAAALFAVIHLDPSQFFTFCCMGAAAGGAVLASGSVGPAVALHAGFNAAALAAGLALGGSPAPPSSAVAPAALAEMAVGWPGTVLKSRPEEREQRDDTPERPARRNAQRRGSAVHAAERRGSPVPAEDAGRNPVALGVVVATSLYCGVKAGIQGYQHLRRRNLRHLVRQVAPVLDRLGVQYWADFGTLLGMYREGDVILHDNDADLVLLNPDWDALLAALRAALPHLRVYTVVPSEDRSITWIRVMSGVGVMDLYGAFYDDGGAAGELSGGLLVEQPAQEQRPQAQPHPGGACGGAGRMLSIPQGHGDLCDVPASLVLPLGVMKFRGTPVSVPADVPGVLRYRYGDTYMVPRYMDKGRDCVEQGKFYARLLGALGKAGLRV